MNQLTSTRTTGSIATRMSACISHCHRQALNRVHVAGDAVAREHGWTITTSPSVFSLGVRIYRDPRFATVQPGVPSTAELLEARQSR